MEVMPLVERALSICMKKLGGSHPYVIGSQNLLEFVGQKVRAQLDCRVASAMCNPRREDLVPLKLGVKTR